MNKVALVILTVFSTIALHAQQSRPATRLVVPSSTVSVDAFADYYYNVQNPVASMKNVNAFELRRVDLGFEHVFSRSVIVYSEVEANSGAESVGSEYSLFVKQAFAELRNILPQMRVVLGLSPTPAVVNSERIWGYRSLAALPLEYYGMAPSVDNGIAIKGKIDPDGVIGYHLMVGNGTGTLRETDKVKRLYASLILTPASGFTLEGYADFENGGNKKYRTTLKGLLGLEETGYALGIEGVYKINHHYVGPSYDQSPYVVSVYGWGQLADAFRLVLRGDYYDDDVNNTTGGIKTSEAMLGFDYLAAPDVHVIPNIVYAKYTNKNSAAPAIDDAVTVRLTAAFNFSAQK
jgi:hypothetical protein